jgi:GH25 family lysozyme M1 (1,4-beta-N-acetylmuramidase)
MAVVAPAGPTLAGVDVSAFQGAVNWNSVAAAGIAFGYARVSDGTALDGTFVANYGGMKAAGLARGAYQYFEPAQDPAAQANLLLHSIGTLGPGDLPPVLDVESTGGQSAATLIAEISTWAGIVENATGRIPAIYTDLTFWNASVQATSFGGNPLWIASYGTGFPNVPSGWNNWAFWQYSSSGTVPGISASVNLDEFDGTAAQLSQFTSAAAMSAVAGNNQSTIARSAFATLLEVQVLDGAGNPINGANITFTATAGYNGAGGTFAGSTTIATNAQGIAHAPVLTANNIAGTFTVTARWGNQLSDTFLLTNLPGAPAGIAVTAGNFQNTIVGTAFASALQATVTDAGGNPVAGVAVLFTVPSQGPGGVLAALPMVQTDARGIATAPRLMANHSRGTFAVSAAALGVAVPASFLLKNTAAPAKIQIVAGSKQHATVATTYAVPLTVKVTDAGGNPLFDSTVEFAVESGTSGAGGSLQSPVCATNGSGLSSTVLTANSIAGALTVEAWGAGLSAPVIFTLTNTAGAPAGIVAKGGTPQTTAAGKVYTTPLQALVSDAYGNHVTGATVTFTVVPNAGAGATFANKTSATAATNASGLATAPPLKANSTTGSFTVVASVAGLNTQLTFDLTIV